MISRVGDVLVMGAGAACLRASIALDEQHASVSCSARRPGMTLPLPPSSAIAEEALTDSRQPATAGHPLE